MRVVPPCQLALGLEETPGGEGHWPDLPEATRGQVQGLLARLIARGALAESLHDTAVGGHGVIIRAGLVNRER